MNFLLFFSVGGAAVVVDAGFTVFMKCVNSFGGGAKHEGEQSNIIVT